MKIGYARVSTKEQNLNLQLDALKKAGCEKIYKEKQSGVKDDRLELEKMLEQLRAGDEVIVWDLSRLGRSYKHLIELVEGFSEKKIAFVSLKDNLVGDSSAMGKLIFHVVASISQMGRDLIIEKTFAGLEAARARGRVGGRPRGLSAKAEATAKTAKLLYESQSMPVNSICQQLNISKATLYRYLKHLDVKIK